MKKDLTSSQGIFSLFDLGRREGNWKKVNIVCVDFFKPKKDGRTSKMLI